jgi:hypothetical protein
MTAAIERIVLQTTPQDKKALFAKARRLDMPVSELMRRAAFAYEAGPAGSGDDELVQLAEAAGAAAERAGAAIDEALEFIAASNLRIAALEAAATRPA